MPITRVTGNVIKDGTLLPDDFSQGKPLWNETGYLSATKFAGSGAFLTGITSVDVGRSIVNALTSTTFDTYISAVAFVGDGTGLTNIIRGLSVVPVTDNTFTVEPKHNSCIIVLNSLSTININVSPFITRPGHITTFIQANVGRGDFSSPVVYNADNFYETKKQYSVCSLLNYEIGGNWTLYGDLTSTSLTAAPPPSTSLSGIGITDIAAGQWHSLILSGGDIYGSGYNEGGILGLNTTVNTYYAYTKVTSPSGIKWTDVAAPSVGYVSYALSGTDLYATGSNLYGQLGINAAGINSYRSTFTRVTTPSNAKWTTVAGGWNFSVALSGTDMYVCGLNDYYQLGLGDNLPRSTFTKVTVPADAKWTAISVGYACIAALSGTDLYVVGWNREGQLGIGSPNSVISSFTRVTTPSNAKWTAVAAGNSVTFALSGSDLYVAGGSGDGRNGINDRVNNISTFTRVPFPANAKWTDIVVGNDVVFALSGTDLYGTGSNSSGQLGLSDTNPRSTFTQVVLPINAKWTKASAGWGFAIALSGTSLYGTGGGRYYGMGNLNRITFTQVSGVRIPT